MSQRKRVSLVPGGFVWRHRAIGLDRDLLINCKAKKSVSLMEIVRFFRVL